MSNMLNDNELDNLFRDSIESAEAQPSEKFWTKAYEGILTRENDAYLSRIRTWKRATVALACIVVGLICYNVYITEKVNNLDNQLTQVEKFQANSDAQGASNSNFATNNKKGLNNNQQDISGNNQSSSVNAVNSVNSINSTTSGQNDKVNNTVSNESGVVAINEMQSNVAAKNKVSFAGNNNYRSRHNHSVVASNEDNNSQQRNVVTMLGSSNSPIKSNTEETESNTNDNQTISNIIYPDNSYSSNDSPDSAVSEPVVAKSHQPSKFKRYVLPHISASVFASYNMADPVMNGYSSADNLSASQLNSRERQTLAYSFGAKLGYDVSSRWTLQTGVNYQVYQFAIASSSLSPQVGEGGTKYYQLVTSSGNVLLPDNIQNSNNSTIAKGSATRSYINIPLQAKYSLVNMHNFRIYATFGASMGLLQENSAAIQAENSGGTENVTVNNLDGTSKVTGSYLIGVGAQYLFSRLFSVYVEPSYLGAITPVNNNSYIKVSNNMVNCAGGVIYHF